MKKLMLLLLLSISPGLLAQEWTEIKNTVICGPFRDMVRVLTQEKYNELPLWVGQSEQDRTSFTLFLNAERGNFTLLQYYQDRACILGTGQTSDIFNLVPFAQKQ